MKKRYVALLFLLLIAAVVYFSALKPMLEIYVGFSAKTACSCHFIQERNLDDVLNTELSPASFIPPLINETDQSVQSSFLGVSRTALFRPQMGCTLLSERNEAEVKGLGRRTIADRLKSSTLELGTSTSALREVVLKAFEEPVDQTVNTRAVIILKDSMIIAEQYAEGYTKDTPLMGWSMTKSVTNALVGILVGEGKLDIHSPIRIEDWYQSENDPRQGITLDHLLRMSSGLFFEEEYDRSSTVNQMLWTKADAGKVAYSQELAYPVDSHWYYSSGTTNIISHVVRNQFEEYSDYIEFPFKSLFNKLGMSSVVMETDANGSYIASSMMYATARDWARFGQLFLQNGVWNGERILSKEWVDYSRTPTKTLHPYDFYGAHFWLNGAEEHPENDFIPRHWPGVPKDAYYASGFEGQTVMIIPSENMVIVRLGQTLDRSAFEIGAFVTKVLQVLS